MSEKTKKYVENFEESIKESRAASPQSMVKRALALVEKQITHLEQVASTQELLEPSEARMLSSYIDDLLRISKEYRDADIDPLEQFRGLSPEEENDFILELAKKKGIIKDGTVVHYYTEKESGSGTKKN